MGTRIFGLKENEDLDEIFTLDDWDPQPNVHRDSREVASKEVEKLKRAMQTPVNQELLQDRNSDSTIGTENTPRIIGTTSHRLSENLSSRLLDEDLFDAYEFSDSAVGTESQSTSAEIVPNQSSLNCLNRTPAGTVGSQASNLWPLMTQRSTSQVFLPSQSDLFSQDLNVASDCFLTPTTSNRIASQHSPDNFHFSSVRQRSTQHQSASNTSLGNLSFYSLMQRSLMRDNLQQSSSSFQLALVTPTATQTDHTQGSSFSQFFNLPVLSGTEPRQYTCNLSEALTNTTNRLSGSSDFLRQFEEGQLDSQSQPLQTTSPIFGSYRQLNYNQNYVESQQYSPDTSLLPKSILELYEQIKSSGLSDWSFVYALSAQTCQEFMPMSYNVTLKMSLLLSIASIDATSDMSPIPIIAFGRDATAANFIMNFMGKFAQRYLAPTDHTFNVMVNSNKMVEVGPVFLAKNGVCYLGDWCGLSKKLCDEIKILIDSGRYFLNETSESFQLGSALWTYWSLMKNRKDFSQVAVFMKYFGIPIMTESNESDDIVEFLLIEAKDGKVDIPDDVLNISADDMKNYLNVVRKVKLRKEDDAQQLLKAYSDAIQRDRGGLLSAKSFQIIQQMAESFAKLSLRDNVLVCDVVGAISIAEKTFYGITGMTRCPLMPPTQDIEMVDQYIQAFHKWIFNYVGTL